MLLVLFHEIGAPKINLFRCFLLSRLGLRELVGTGCFGRSAELNVQRFGFLVKPGVDFLGFKLLVKIKLDSVRSGLAQTFDVLRLFHAPTRLTQSDLTSVLINVLFLRRCRLGDITRSMCNVSLSRYYNVGGIYLVRRRSALSASVSFMSTLDPPRYLAKQPGQMLTCSANSLAASKVKWKSTSG